jgi:hypothetical protein
MAARKGRKRSIGRRWLRRGPETKEEGKDGSSGADGTSLSSGLPLIGFMADRVYYFTSVT